MEKGFLESTSHRPAAIVAAFLAVGTAFLSAESQSATIHACVEPHSGALHIVAPGTACSPNRVPLQWEQGASGGGAGSPPPAALNVQYVTGGIVPDTSVARAFCPAGTIVTGGGAITDGAGLQQSFPISDAGGLIAWGSNAIGWQAAASNWGFVQAFVVCVGS